MESNTESPYRLLDTVTAVFVTVLLTSNIASAAKIVDLGISIGSGNVSYLCFQHGSWQYSPRKR